MKVHQETLKFTMQVKKSKEMAASPVSGDDEEWVIMARDAPHDLDFNKLRAWLEDLFPGTQTLMNQVTRTGNSSVLLSFKSLLLAELVLDVCSRCTSFCWRRTYSDSSLAGLKETPSLHPSTLICVHGIDPSNEDAQAYLNDLRRTWRLPENELVIEMKHTNKVSWLCYNLDRVSQNLIIWRSDDFLPNIMRKTPGFALTSPDLTQEKKKRLREEEEEDQAGRNRQKLGPGQWNETRRHTTPQEKLVLRRLPDGFRCEELEMFFKQIPRSGNCWCRVVATREKNTAIVELASEADANQIMDEYVRKPENFRGLAIYRDRAYVRPGSVIKNKQGEERVENPEPVIVEGFSSELEHPELKASLCELLERVFAGNRSITECGASLLREFHLRHNRAFVSFNSNAALEAILSLEKPLFLGGRALRFKLGSDNGRRYYYDEAGHHRDEARRYDYHHQHEGSDNRSLDGSWRRYPGHCGRGFHNKPHESERRWFESQPRYVGHTM